jgi:hypothetical protein
MHWDGCEHATICKVVAMKTRLPARCCYGQRDTLWWDVQIRIEGCSFHHANVHEQNTRDGWKTVFGICLEYHWTKPHNKIGFATWFEISLQAARVHILLIQLFFFRVRDEEDASFTFDSGCFTIYSSLFITSDSIFFGTETWALFAFALWM